MIPISTIIVYLAAVTLIAKFIFDANKRNINEYGETLGWIMSYAVALFWPVIFIFNVVASTILLVMIAVIEVKLFFLKPKKQ